MFRKNLEEGLLPALPKIAALKPNRAKQNKAGQSKAPLRHSSVLLGADSDLAVRVALIDAAGPATTISDCSGLKAPRITLFTDSTLADFIDAMDALYAFTVSV